MKNTYDANVGYSPLEFVNREKLSRDVKIKKQIIDQYRLIRENEMLFVAGMGNGEEALLLHDEYDVQTIGSDLFCDRFIPIDGNRKLHFQYQDLLSLGFVRDTFSLIYCNHVLEHVDDHVVVLKELHRVLKPGGVLFIGFPNKKRIIAYTGTSQNASVLDKIMWNLNDYRYKLQGKFENKYGAHAGFTENEFYRNTSELFSKIHSVRNQFMILKYPKYSKFFKLLIKIGMGEYIFPSNYYVCEKS